MGRVGFGSDLEQVLEKPALDLNLLWVLFKKPKPDRTVSSVG